jgi:uncharacterized protein YdhG (YjbR/CyaY superfamily)
MGAKAVDVNAYLAALPAERGVAVRRLLDLASSIFPGTALGIDYGMPVLKRDGTMCIAVASQKQYVSIYGLGQAVLEAHRDALKAADLGKGCVRYRKMEAIDYTLIEAMMIERRDAGHGDGC